VRRYPDELPELAARLGGIKTPVMVFAGLRDRVVPLANAEFLAERLPNCRQATLGAGHFVWEEVPDAFAQLLCEWIHEHH
jgi:pimeloyl-ACP methyl ester carboxylesterase